MSDESLESKDGALVEVIPSDESLITTAPDPKELAIARLQELTGGRMPARQLMERADRVGLLNSPAVVNRATQLVQNHGTKLGWLVNWRESGMSLNAIGYYLNLRDRHQIVISLPLIQWYSENSGLVQPVLRDGEIVFGEYGAIGIEVIFDILSEIIGHIGKHGAEYWIKKVIEEHFGGNVMLFYHQYMEDPETILAYFGCDEISQLRMSEEDQQWIEGITRDNRSWHDES